MFLASKKGIKTYKLQVIVVHIRYVHYGTMGCGVFKRGYKIRKIFAQESTYSKEIIEFKNWVNGEL